MQQRGLPALVNTKTLPPYDITGVLRERNMPQMKGQIKTPEKALSNEEIANLSDAQFKTQGDQGAHRNG